MCIRDSAQTGNIVLMATNFCEGDFAKALRYLVPRLAFAAGVYFAEGIRNRYHLMESCLLYTSPCQRQGSVRQPNAARSDDILPERRNGIRQNHQMCIRDRSRRSRTI